MSDATVGELRQADLHAFARLDSERGASANLDRMYEVGYCCCVPICEGGARHQAAGLR